MFYIVLLFRVHDDFLRQYGWKFAHFVMFKHFKLISKCVQNDFPMINVLIVLSHISLDIHYVHGMCVCVTDCALVD